MAEYLSNRRYCLYKRYNAKLSGEDALESLWQCKQALEPGTALPSGFPNREQLAAAGYTTDEDLNGADAQEIHECVGLSQGAAEAVIAAYAAL